MAFERELTFLLCVAGIYGCYLYYGVLQERLLKGEQEDGSRFSFVFVLLLVQCAINGGVAGTLWALSSLAARLGLMAESGGKGVDRSATVAELVRPECQRRFALTALSYVLAMLFSNEALKYVSYPLQALAKSCKMIPVMLMRVVIRRHRYPLAKYALVLLMTAGVATFQFAKLKGGGDGGKESSALGVGLLFGSLVMDGFTGPKQEELNELYRPSNTAFMTLTNAWAVLIMAVIATASGELVQGMAYLGTHPQAMMDLLLFSLCSAAGQLFIYLTVRTFDSLVLTTVTTTRKFATIVVSVIVFGHHLSAMQWAAIGMVFAAIVGDVVLKYTSGDGHHSRGKEGKGKTEGEDEGAGRGATNDSNANRDEAGLRQRHAAGKS